jgi:hypothetical protein
VARSTAGAADNSRRLLAAEAGPRGAGEERAEANKAAQNLILGWDWGKWTFDLCLDYQLYNPLDGWIDSPVSMAIRR